MIVRRASARDADALTACFVAAYAPYLSLGLPPVTEGIAEDIRDHSVWVAEVDGNVCGGIVVTFGDHAHIANLAVHPNAGANGIGKALIDQAFVAARTAGHATMHLATHADMGATQAFYRKHGWIETGRDGKKVYFRFQLT
jgi:ribosomal protein S18 acetylase RimI-like enzyme